MQVHMFHLLLGDFLAHRFCKLDVGRLHRNCRTTVVRVLVGHFGACRLSAIGGQVIF